MVHFNVNYNQTWNYNNVQICRISGQAITDKIFDLLKCITSIWLEFVGWCCWCCWCCWCGGGCQGCCWCWSLFEFPNSSKHLNNRAGTNWLTDNATLILNYLINIILIIISFNSNYVPAKIELNVYCLDCSYLLLFSGWSRRECGLSMRYKLIGTSCHRCWWHVGVC